MTPRSFVRIVRTELTERVCEAEPLSGPEDAARILCKQIGGQDREHFAVLHLNTKNRINAIETVSIGTLNASLVHPREIFKGAILANAAAIICGHNHPSGDLEPSSEDKATLERLVKTSKIIGIQVLDFLVVSRNRYARLNAFGIAETGEVES